MRSTLSALTALAFVAVLAPAVPAQQPSGAGATYSPAQLAERTKYRRAVEAVIWGMPLVNTDAMRQAYFRDIGARYNDICYFSKPADWRFQVTTPNASTNYVYFNFNLKDGPVVLDVPPTVGAGLLGVVVDAWDAGQADVGPAGEDQGKGGKYLLLPPDFNGAPPAGYIPVRFQTFNGYGLLRAIPAGSTAGDVEASLGLVRKLRLYPFAQAANPPEQRFIDIHGKTFDGIATFDDTFFEKAGTAGQASFYLITYRDKDGVLLSGENTYVLRIPPDVPAKQYWSAIAYDLQTSAFVREAPVITLDSYSQGLKKNADGSIDLYFGPKAPSGQESNWIATAPKRGWFVGFRLYGPDKPLFDRTWKLSEIERVSAQ